MHIFDYLPPKHNPLLHACQLHVIESTIIGDNDEFPIKVNNGVPFAISRHIKRLSFSAQGLGITSPDDNLVRKAIEEVLEKDIPKAIYHKTE